MIFDFCFRSGTLDYADDSSYLWLDCVDDDGTGCAIQVSLELDVCLLKFKFRRDQVFDMIKRPFMYVIETALSGDTDLCEEPDLKIEVCTVGFKDDAQCIGRGGDERRQTLAGQACRPYYIVRPAIYYRVHCAIFIEISPQQPSVSLHSLLRSTKR